MRLTLSRIPFQANIDRPKPATVFSLQLGFLCETNTESRKIVKMFKLFLGVGERGGGVIILTGHFVRKTIF